MKQTVRLLDPTASASATAKKSAPRLTSLESKRLLLLWNAKSNGDAVLRGVEAGLRAKGWAFDSELVKKEVAIAAAGEELLDEVTQRAAAVVGAVAD